MAQGYPWDSRVLMYGFAARTRTNLNFVVSAPNKSQVHLVTQIVTSMLGLLVFPQQYLDGLSPDAVARQLFSKEAKNRGWPDWKAWKFDPKMPKAMQTKDYRDFDGAEGLLKHLRNALSHYRVRFSPPKKANSRDPKDVTVEFFDRLDEGGPDDWHAWINGAQLLDFVRGLADTLDHVLPMQPHLGPPAHPGSDQQHRGTP
jgi:hypothetical protein